MNRMFYKINITYTVLFFFVILETVEGCSGITALTTYTVLCILIGT